MIHRPPSAHHREQIYASLEELSSLREDGFTTIPKLSWWLLKYDWLYEFCKENWNYGSCAGEMACCYTMGSAEDQFRHFYEGLEEVVSLHKMEAHLGQQMEVLKQVREDYPALMEWLRQNEKLGTEEFFLFWIEWLNEPDAVMPHLPQFKKPEIKFQAAVFANSIRFMEVFNELYWTSEVCPEFPVD